ncbi:MAG: ABC transporter permease [Marinoscillum sp.]
MKSNPTPPKLASRLLTWLISDELAEEVLGDLEEKFYATLERRSLFKAQLNYWYQVINYLRPFAFKRSKYSNHNAMIKHSLILTFRGYKRRKSSFLINLIGLSTGLAAVLLITLWVSNEFQTDKFHSNSDRLYLVMEQHTRPDYIGVQESTPSPLAKAIKDQIPQIDAATAIGFSDKGNQVLSHGSKHIRGKGMYAQSDFFKMFSFDLIQYGTNPLSDPTSIVLTESMAEKLFGTTSDLIGKQVVYSQERTFRIDGICTDPPLQSTLQFDYVIPYSVLMEEIPWLSDWRNTYGATYVLLSDAASSEKVNPLIYNVLNEKVESQYQRNLFLKKFSEHYLYGSYENGEQSGGRITYVKLLSLIAGFTLLMACVNFMNLSTANATRRLKEIGVKKVVGASRLLLASQYFIESLLMAAISLIVAIGLTGLFWSNFQSIIGRQMTFSLDYDLLAGVVGITILTGVIAGSYPALYLSGFKPMNVLKGKIIASNAEVWIRKILVVFQFTLSIVIVIFVGIVYLQIQYTQTKDLGFDRDHVVYFDAEGKVSEDIGHFVDRLNTVTAIKGASSAYFGFIGATTGTSAISWQGKDPTYNQHFEYRVVNYGFLDVMGIEMVSGRDFSRDRQVDSKSVILNETAARVMGLKNPIGEKMEMWGTPYAVLGVVKDFNYQSLYSNINPIIFMLSPSTTATVFVKLKSDEVAEGLRATENVWQEFAQGFPFDYTFMDTEYQKFYEEDRRVADVSKFFAGLAVLISCLGLFGLAVFSTERRVKEIGIRKILGASSMVIMNLLSIEFLKMVLIALVISLPVAYYLGSEWLAHFEYHQGISWLFFGLVGVGTIIIAWLTISLHTMKAASKNPVENLSDE